MSYSTRRSGGYGQQTPQKNIGNIGQRRPVANNFVQGGQLSSQAKPATATPARPQQNQQAAAATPFRNQPAQQQQIQQQANAAKQQQTTAAKQVQQQATVAKQQVQQQATVAKQQVQQQATAAKQQVPQQTQQRLQQQQQQAAQQQQQQQVQQQQQQQAQQQQQQQVQQQQQQQAQQQQQQQAQQQQQQVQQQQAQQQLQVQLKQEKDVQEQMQKQQLQDQLKEEQQQKPTQEQQQSQATDGTNGTPMEVEEPKKKHFWARTGSRVLGGKISRRERVRRRNVKLSKILQPKNAVMILNELVKNTSYMIEELPVKSDGNQFKATVLYEGTEHVGYGRNKISAKNEAAEAALKHYVKTNKLTEVKKDEDGNEKMDVSEDDTTQSPLPWQHVASFALYKLFCTWGEDPNLVKVCESGQTQSQNIVNTERPHENRPSKKMPENPETLNPLMLINQMLPHAQFEEMGKSGNLPDVVFSFRCNVDGQSFIGVGPNKKSAKRMAAFGACHKILSISYPPEIYVPNNY